MAGLVALEVAVSPPVDTLSDQLLMAHMAEHLLIGDIAALLLVLGLTGPLIAPLLRNPVIARLRVLTHPVVAIVLWAINFYVWHSPVPLPGGAAPRRAARARARHLPGLRDGGVDGAAGPAAQARSGSTTPRGWCYIIAVRLTGTVLANVLIFGGHRLLPDLPVRRRPLAHLPTADQVAAGGLMMVEESFLTIGLFCWLFLRVARENEERQELLDYAVAARPRARRAPGGAGGGGGARRRAVGAAARARSRWTERAYLAAVDRKSTRAVISLGAQRRAEVRWHHARLVAGRDVRVRA